MSKYLPLQYYLEKLPKDSWKANFSEIEKILGFSLPKSARTYNAWWSNNSQDSRQSKIWLDIGWQTEHLNFVDESIVFKKLDKPVSVLFRKQNEPSTELCSWDEGCAIETRIVMEWQAIGRIVMDAHGRLDFPKVSKIPAIYRFRIKYVTHEERYIGETNNLRRRFHNYRNPGSTQQTSLRINAIIINALAKGAEISVSAVTTQVSVDFGKELATVNLKSKAMRCLCENAAILESGATSVDMLNKI